jgi:hypothetical protein
MGVGVLSALSSPMKTKEKAIAKQLGLKPINPNATPAPAPAAQQ